MPAPPDLLASTGAVVGIAGCSFAAFVVVSFLEVKKKYEGPDFKPYTPPPPELRSPPASKTAASPRGPPPKPPPPPKTARGFRPPPPPPPPSA